MMCKKISITVIALCYGLFCFSQVTWDYVAKKIADKTYELHITATIEEPWHIYSQTTPSVGSFPTVINFGKNPLIIAQGKTKKQGNCTKNILVCLMKRSGIMKIK